MLSKCTVEDELKYLHSRLPKHPTSVEGTYLLPKHLRKEVLNSDFSQVSLQKVSDHIGFFLGLLNSVKIKIGIESSENMLSATSYAKKRDNVGLYKVIGGHIREIQLTKKVRFELCHILGILAHESTHDYLYHHGINRTDELDNERLTDLAAAFLGLGGLLLEGYEPIHWTSDEWDILIASGRTEHEMEIGYITPENIRYAIFLSTKLRGIKKLATPLSAIGRLRIYCYFRQLRKKEEINYKQIQLLQEKRRKAESLYGQIESKIKKASEMTTQLKVTPEDGCKLAEIANTVALGNMKFEIDRLLRNVNTLANSVDSGSSYFTNISSQVDNILKTVSDWDKVISKYV